MANGDRWQVTASIGLNVRSKPTTSSQKLGALAYGAIVTQTTQAGSNQDIWIGFNYNGQTGYSNWKYLKNIGPAKTNTTTTNPPQVPTTTIVENNVLSGLNSDGTSTTTEGGLTYTAEELASMALNSYTGNSDFYKIDSVLGVFGLPYQFLPSTDPRIDNSKNNASIGIEYADKIIGNIPIMFLMPGRPNFMAKFSTEERQNAIKAILDMAGGGDSGYATNLNSLLSNDGRYYVFDEKIEEYYRYVNPMCRIAARYLGIQDFQLGGIWTLDNMDWKQYALNKFTLSSALTDATEYGNVAFYIDSETSVNENFGNTTTESSIASSVNGISDLTREIHFLTGYVSAATDTDWLSKNADVFQNVQNMNDFISSTLGNGNFLSNLGKHLTTVVAGGKLIFPEIWADSSLSRSYNVKFKFVSPDCNKFSIFLNVLVPLFHLIGFVGPQSVSGNPNGYLSPFLVRGIYKSFFNVDMGIITDMSVTKGGDCLWTADGLPTSIEVDITIKDLYDIMALTASDNLKYDTMDNTAQMDYIANLCGINMYKPEIGRQLSMWLMNNFENRVLDVGRDIYSGVKSAIADACRSLWRRNS